MKTEPSLLLLIPAYNEELRIEPVLRDYARYFKEHYRGKFQLIVVLNGCTDDTIGVVRRVAAEYLSVSAWEFTEAIGKGGALIEGLKLAPLAEVIGYVDADGASPPHAFHDLVNRIGEADCVIGSRWLRGAVLHHGCAGSPAGVFISWSNHCSGCISKTPNVPAKRCAGERWKKSTTACASPTWPLMSTCWSL
jgi:glycosyltransferase involved in cell wall biosynthesis